LTKKDEVAFADLDEESPVEKSQNVVCLNLNTMLFHDAMVRKQEFKTRQAGLDAEGIISKRIAA